MISSETSSAGGAAKSAHAWWSPQCSPLMVIVFSLIISFVLVDAGTGTDQSAFTSNHVTSIKEDPPISKNDNTGLIKMQEPPSQPSPQPCSGDRPGVCP